MANSELDEAIIKATQQALGKYVKKPPLTDKLLRKPPFRFLLDVFNAFIRQTGCFEGLYTAEEQLFENIRDRDDKTRYLQKMIDAIKLATHKELKVRTSKIVAGHEPELTNELLQQMAAVAEQRLDWESAVDQLVGNNAAAVKAPAKPKEKEKEKQPKTSKNISPTSKEERTKRATVERKEKRTTPPQEQKIKRTTPTEKEKEKEKVTRKPKTEVKLGSRQNSKQKSPSPVKPKAKQQTSTESETMSPQPMPAKTPSAELAKPVEPPATPKPVEQPPPSVSEAAKEEPESRLSSAQRRSSASSSKSRKSSAKQREELDNGPAESSPAKPPPPAADNNNNSNNNNNVPGEVKRENTFTRDNSKDSTSSLQRPRTSLRPPSARPASARPGAPRRRDRNVEIVLQPNDQVKVSGINMKLETFGDFEDDGENLVIIEDANAHDIADGVLQQAAATLDMDQAMGQGHLVQQILETQKELVADAAGAKDEQQLSQLGARQSSARQMDGLRDIIQNLTKSVNPFGKLMDFIPEDIDAMQLELSMWRDTYTQSAVELKRERHLTESSTEPLKQQLLQIEASRREYAELVDASRHKILQNSERILKMLMEQ